MSLAARVLDRARAGLSTRLARDAAALFSLNVLGRALALGKEVLVAALFGVGGQLDAYVLALLAPSFLSNLLGASFASALIPALARAEAADGKAGAATDAASPPASPFASPSATPLAQPAAGGAPGQGCAQTSNTQACAAASAYSGALLSGALLVLCGLLALAALLLWALPPQALRALSPLADDAALARLRSLQLALLPVALLGGVANVLGALVNLRGDFKGPALASMANTLVLALCAASLSARLGIDALVLGLDAGFALETGIVLLLARRAYGPLPGPSWARCWPELRALLRGYGSMALSAAILGLSAFVDNALASLAGEGAVSALAYAAKIPSAAATLGGLTLSTLLLPHFSASVHSQSPQAFWADFTRLLRLLLLTVGPLALLAALASRPLAALAFQRGGFDAQATALVSGIQVFYLLQLPFYLTGVAASRVLQAQARHHLLLGMVSLALLGNAALSWLLVGRLGAPGIALSSLCMYACTALCSVLLVRRGCRG